MSDTTIVPEITPSAPQELAPNALYDKCMSLARNLWWTWQPDVINLFRDLDPIRWRQLDHNPIALLTEFTPDRLAARGVGNDAVQPHKLCLSPTERVYGGQANMGAPPTRAYWELNPLPIFSAEFGIHEGVPIYSGGLGVLSGDHIKSASGLGVPLVAIGLFYDQGYFKQHLNDEGYQKEEYLQTKVENLAIEPALDPDGKPISITIETRKGTLLAKLWLMHVGRVKLYLLDCDVEGNSPEDRELTSRLYGGDERTRVRQELVWGVGGVRALKALGITPGVYHLNEGHSAFAPLEVIRERMEDDGMTFDNALREVAQQTVFTTHTPVPAGHDRFDGPLVEEHLGPVRDQLGISYEQLMGTGTCRTAKRIRIVLHDGCGIEALTTCECRESITRSHFASDVGSSLAVAGSRKKFRSGTSPTASMCPVGSRGKCNSFTTGTSLWIGRGVWVSRKCGRKFTMLIQANSGKHITR